MPPSVEAGRYYSNRSRWPIEQGGCWPRRAKNLQPVLPVIVEFSGMDQARRWYDSEEYRDLRQLRFTATVSNEVFMAGL